MKARSYSFRFLYNTGTVEVPFFQRGYVWGEDNWDALLDDLADFEKKPYLGSLILKQVPTSSGAPKQTLVIDGQQRLTTLSILLKALYDSASEALREGFIHDIRNYLFFRAQAADKNFSIRIKHSRLDREAYCRVIRAGIENEDRIDFPAKTSNRIISCYSQFRSKLDEMTEDHRARLFQRIVDQDNEMLVVIDLEKDDDEQTIFDTINSAGIRLSCADIVKNALFQGAIRLAVDQDNVTELYDRTWEAAFGRDDETREYWERQETTGRVSRDNLEILLHSVAIIKNLFDPEKHTLVQLSKLYKQEVENYVQSGKLEFLEQFINEVQKYGEIYRERIPAFDRSTGFAVSIRNQRLFHILEVLQISTFHPFILYLLKEFDEEKCDYYFSCLERYIVRRMICNQDTKNYNKLCRNFIRDPDLLVAGLRETKDEDVKAGLKSIGNKNAALLLFWVELQRKYEDKKHDQTELTYCYSLEHVMPVKWEEHWSTMPLKQNPDGSIMSDEEAKKDRQEKIGWIGNMTLLTSSLNSSLRNFSFEKKIKGEGRKNGIWKYATLSITKDDIVAAFDAGDWVWDEEKIKERNSKITDEILKIWSA